MAESLKRHAMTAGIVPGVVSADAALHEKLPSHKDLATMVERVRHWPRSSRAGAMLSFCDGRRETVGDHDAESPWRSPASNSSRRW